MSSSSSRTKKQKEKKVPTGYLGSLSEGWIRDQFQARCQYLAVALMLQNCFELVVRNTRANYTLILEMVKSSEYFGCYIFFGTLQRLHWTL